ncbi:hypothetical protein GCM10022419_008170 [Nonomuraea rosea]|uniref:Molecular chaperone DnaJ n=1 Tax=Nonomuraea rosea TaxID=638574 RepID=A0ABP6VEE5_9ACTN
MTDRARTHGYLPGMPKDDDEAPPVCGTCLGAGGEWMEMNGKKGQERKWVPCDSCGGSGRA